MNPELKKSVVISSGPSGPELEKKTAKQKPTPKGCLLLAIDFREIRNYLLSGEIITPRHTPPFLANEGVNNK